MMTTDSADDESVASDETTPTTDTVVSNATIPGVLPKKGLTLLGTIVTPSGARALLRHSAGGVEQVGPGDKVSGHEVAAIEDGFILLSRAGETKRLTLPLH
jgi:hypothetical protein